MSIKKFAYSLLSTLYCLTSWGQSSELTIGVRSGLNAASANSVSINKLYDALQLIGNNTKISPLIGLHAGVIVQKRWSHFSLQSELLFSQYGVKIEKGLNTAEFKSSVLELPLLAKYTFGNGRIKFFLYAGPFINYALSGQYQLTAQLFSLPLTVKEAIQFQAITERTSWGIATGSGVSWPIGNGYLLTEIRYSYSLQSKVPSSVIGLGGTNIYARLASISVGYLFPLK